MSLESFSLYINGEFRGASDGGSFTSEDPYRREPWCEVPEATLSDLDEAVAAARGTLDGEWGAMTGFDRARLMRRLADLIGENAARLAELEVRDSGKLYREMIGQMTALPQWFYYFSGVADKLEGRSIPSDKPNYVAFTRLEPVGVV
ncbi:MAG: aldehyde dehydrogenase family protein, partial [Nocardioides sp.]